MEKDIGKISKNATTDIVVRIDDFGGKPGVTIREYVSGETYTGFTKAGTRIPADKFLDFRELVNTINISELKADTKQETKVKPKEKEKSEEKAKVNEEEIEEELF